MPPTCYNLPMHILLTIVAIGVGTLIAVQPAINTQLSRSLGHPYYGVLANFGVGLVLITLIGLFVVRPNVPRQADLAGAPWWAWCGGALGVVFVSMSILLLPRLGAVLLIGSILVGQLVAASAIDQFGLLGVARHALSPARVAGLAFLLVGLILVQFGTRPAPSAERAPATSAATPAPHPPPTDRTA